MLSTAEIFHINPSPTSSTEDICFWKFFSLTFKNGPSGTPLDPQGRVRKPNYSKAERVNKEAESYLFWFDFNRDLRIPSHTASSVYKTNESTA